MKRNAIIPSMFHRRLTLLGLLVAGAVLVLIGQLYRITIVQGAQHLSDAQSVLTDSLLLPTYRGRILDRNGLVLAYDKPVLDLLVDYRLISGEWAESQAAAEARRASADQWDELSTDDRSDLIADYLPRYEREVDAVWTGLAGLSGQPLDDILKRRDEIHDRVERMAKSVWERWRAQEERQYQTSVTIDEVRKPIREQQEGHVILEGVAADREAQLKAFARAGPMIAANQPAITIETSGIRAYPLETQDVVLPRDSLPGSLKSDQTMQLQLHLVMDRLLGKVRDQVFSDELKARPLYDDDGHIVDLGGYLASDKEVGSTGIEASMERYLRGSRGRIVHYFDGQSDERQDPAPGADIQLTIDSSLQAAVQGILDPRFGLTRVEPWHGDENALPPGTPLAAGVVVIDIRTDEILAAVSSPSDLPDDVARIGAQLDNRHWTQYQTPSLPDRALGAVYSPGSIVKPLMLTSAISQGRWSINRTVDCTGHFYPDDTMHLRCWLYRPPGYGSHGVLGPIQAIAESCDLYFYTVGQALGADGLVKAYEGWGLNRKLNIGVPVQDGLISKPTSDQVSAPMMMGIGQGPVAWTPLLAANAYAALARGGIYMTPLLIRHDPRGSMQEHIDMNLNDESVYLALKGIYEVVNNKQIGGARHIVTDPDTHRYEPIFNTPGVCVWGKTGTAQYPWPTSYVQYKMDGTPERDAAGNPVIARRDPGMGAHSWFVGLAGRENTGNPTASRAQYAIAVLVEWGGSGSRCAAPIANQVIRALADRGYFSQ